MGKNRGRLALDDFPGEAFGDGSLADTGIADQERVVLAAAAQHLNATLDLGFAADQRVNLALAGLDVEIDAEFRQSGILGIARLGLGGLDVFVGPGDRARLAKGRVLGDTMGDVVDRIIARHVLFLQEIGGVGFAFGKDRDQHIGTGHFGAARGLHMDRGALDDALESGGRHRFGAFDIGD